MLKELNIKTTFYEVEEFPGFQIEAVDMDEYVEFWLFHKNYGIKTEMFGLPKNQNTHEEMLRIVEGNLIDHVISFQEDYIDMDDWMDFGDCENDDDEENDARMEDFGLDVNCNFFSAPMCPCGCGHKSRLCMETPEEIRNAITGILLSNDCESCGVFFEDMSCNMKVAVKGNGRIRVYEVARDQVDRLDEYVNKLQLHQYALLIEEEPGSWYVVEK